ncbi:hypothetical protein P9112_008662 [Eukaryota sp. TZLM1-RC]
MTIVEDIEFLTHPNFPKFVLMTSYQSSTTSISTASLASLPNSISINVRLNSNMVAIPLLVKTFSSMTKMSSLISLALTLCFSADGTAAL